MWVTHALYVVYKKRCGERDAQHKKDMRTLKIDDVQERWQGTLRDIVELPLQTPEVQRNIDAYRVEAIVAYQRERMIATKSYLFVGDVAVIAKSRGDARLWVVDGQHRLAAAKQLVAEAPGHPVTVLVLALGPTLTLQQAFHLINCAAPVPDWLVHGTLCAVHRCALRGAEAELRKRYGPFFSSATTPRRPNVSMNALTSVLATAAARQPDAFPNSAANIVAFVEYANERMRDMYADAPVNVAALAKAQKARCQPLFLANDATFEFAMAWLGDFSNRSSSTGDRLHVNPEIVYVAKKTERKKLPKALRLAVWNKFFTDRAGVGRCTACNREITQQSFEAGHVVAACAGGRDDIDNLKPVCAPCNRSMGSQNMEDFIRTHLRTRSGDLTVSSFCIDVME